MTGECKVQLDAIVDAEARKQMSQRDKSSSKITTVVLPFTLCLAAAAAAFVLVFHMNGAEGSRQDEDTFDLHHTLRQISNVRAAIHLEGEYNPEVKTSVEWKNQVDQSHSQGGLKLHNNEIIIPQSGLYFVYSQVSFQVSCSSSSNADATASNSNALVHLSHTVQRWSHSYGADTSKSYQTILHSVRTACQKTAGSEGGEDGSWFTAVYMGAVFNLMRGDRLRTVMEEKMLPNLEEEPGKNFFGVFAL